MQLHQKLGFWVNEQNWWRKVHLNFDHPCSRPAFPIEICSLAPRRYLM
jgi:hypothetical protein